MSRIGNKPIDLPTGVTVEVQPSAVVVKGPKGTLRVPLPAGIRLERQDGRLVARREKPEQSALHGLARSIVANAVRGVSQGFEKHLDIVGIGYRAEVKAKTTLLLTLGYSHAVEYPIPEGLAISVEKQTHLVVSGQRTTDNGRLTGTEHAETAVQRPDAPPNS